MQTVIHPLAPIFSATSRVLLLGTMPSPASREAGFYYAHARNRFWPVLSAVLGEECAQTSEQRRFLLPRHHIALWDVLQSCEIEGAKDASIRNPQPNPIATLLQTCPIRAVFTTGRQATALYHSYCLPQTGMPAQMLPSTSAANAAWGMPALIAAYRAILPYLQDAP